MSALNTSVKRRLIERSCTSGSGLQVKLWWISVIATEGVNTPATITRNGSKRTGSCTAWARRGNCWDNAPTESFFAGLKKERAHRTYFATRQQARSAVFFWFEVWYNRKRRHSSLSTLSPEAFEKKYRQLQSKAVALPEIVETSHDASGGVYASSS